MPEGADKMFFRKKYSKLPGGMNWAKNTLLKRMLEDVQAKNVQIATGETDNLWLVNEDAGLYLLFQASNFNDKKELALLGTFVFRKNGDEVVWDDVFNLCQQYYADTKYRALEIYRDQEYSSSNIENEVNEVVLPLIAKLKEPETLKLAVSGAEVILNEKAITLSDISGDEFFQKYPL